MEGYIQKLYLTGTWDACCKSNTLLWFRNMDQCPERTL